MRKGIYRTEASILLPNQYIVLKGSEVLAMGLTEDEAEKTLNNVIEQRKKKIAELMLDVHTQEQVRDNAVFGDEKRAEAYRKIKKLMQEWQDILIEIGEL